MQISCMMTKCQEERQHQLSQNYHYIFLTLDVTFVELFLSKKFSKYSQLIKKLGGKIKAESTGLTFRLDVTDLLLQTGWEKC